MRDLFLIMHEVTGTCECVSYLGPALGGGHGWLQGQHGLMADQFISMDVVLANGDIKTIEPGSDLFWAMQGAGHNFGIVTSVTSKIYNITHRGWAIETLIYSGDKVEDVYEAANEYIVKSGKQDLDIVNWSYWLNDPEVDEEKVSTLTLTYRPTRLTPSAYHNILHHPRGGQKRR